MDNKPIIIDGVNVADCEHINACDKKMKCVILQDDVCETNPYCEGFNCYFKQLTSKTQECEDLKFKVHDLRQLRELDREARKRFVQQLDQLKAENEELKKECNIYTCGICGNKEDYNKLYKTLAEIKEIVSENKNTIQYSGICRSILKIIQKSEEVDKQERIKNETN